MLAIIAYDVRMKFSIEKKLKSRDAAGKNLARAGRIETPHGVIETPAFIVVGTKATVKALTPEQVADLGAQATLENTYHLYLQPGDELIRDAGGVGKFMNWQGPTFTDSGGFQAFSLGAAFNKKASKISDRGAADVANKDTEAVELSAGRINPDETIGAHAAFAKVDEDGVTFRSIIDGSEHRFTPERSIEIQHNIGADIMFAFDECTSPHASYEYLREAMDRTHRWAERSLARHVELSEECKTQDGMKETGGHFDGRAHPPALFGIIQGGRHADLRKESAKVIAEMQVNGREFDGFGIGGSFDKDDIYIAVGWVNEILPENKPRHLLGIGEPEDLFGGVENGIDTFDCVTPTRIARNGSLYTSRGKINIFNAKHVHDLQPIEAGCGCYTCKHYTVAYLSHLFRAKEMLAATLASIHNLYFIVNLVKKIRQSILDDNFYEFKEAFLKDYISRGL